MQALQEARTVTFQSAAEQYYHQHERKWSSATHRQAFVNTLQRYAYPVIGKLPVAASTPPPCAHCRADLACEEPNRVTVRGRIEAVLDWSTVRGFRTGDNPARWQGHLDQVLPSEATSPNRCTT